MRKNSLLYTAFALIALLGIVHIIAETFYLYWTLWWFDNVSHFLGGLALGVFIVWFLNPEKRSPGSFLTVLACLLALGVAWEIFEYINDLSYSIEGYALDTTTDLIMDALGATLAYFLTTSQSQQFS